MKTWFNIARNAASSEVTIDIFDEIGSYGISAKQFITQLREVESTKNMRLLIDSPGGDCEQGLTIFDALIATGADITADIIGTAASMASVIMLAAPKRRIAENGRVMIHRVTGGSYGNADDLEAATKLCRQFEDRIVKLYMKATGKDETAIRELMKAQMGTWFFGSEAVDAGFCDEVITGTKARAFQTKWAPLFTLLPSALFDNSSTTSPSANPDPDSTMKLTAEKKARLIALLCLATLTDAEKAELTPLQADAKADNYDPAADVKAAKAANTDSAKRRKTMKDAGFTDVQIDAAFKAVAQQTAETALEAKRTALKASGLTDKQINKVLASAAKATADGAKIQQWKDAGLSDAEITAALKAAKPDEDEDEDEVEESGVAAAVATAIKPLVDQVTNLQRRIDQGVLPGNVGGSSPTGHLQKLSEEGEVAAPTNKAELEAALAKCKTHAEKRALITAFDKLKG